MMSRDGITALLPAASLMPALEPLADLSVVGAPVDDAAVAAITDLYREIMPEGGEIARFHVRKRRAFDAMQGAEKGIREIMSS